MISSAAPIRSLKILVLTNLYPPQVLGGYERSIADFARLLQHRGHEVLVLTSDTPKLFALHESNYPEPRINRCFLLLGEWSSQGTRWLEPEIVMQHLEQNQQTLQQHLDTFQPDVCFAGNLDFLQTATELIDALLARNIPIAHYVMNAHPGYPVEAAPKRSLYRYVTCSDWVTQTLAAAGYPTATAQTIYPGANVEAFYKTDLPPHDRLRIAYASLVAPYKGADVLVEALAILNATGAEFSATIAGGTFQPEFVEALQAFVASEKLQDKVQFAGALSRQQLCELYQTHNVLVFPSRFQEPFGISQIEAMAAGLTLVTSGTGGAKEIVAENGRDGFVFETENALDLADTLLFLINNPSEWKSASRCGQQRAITDFTQQKAVKQVEAVFAELLSLQNANLEAKQYKVGQYFLLLPLDHKLDAYQASWRRYDTAIGYIAQAVFNKYPNSSAIDIGANVGDSAALIRTNTNVPILCIEGSPVFVPYLKQNALGLENVEIEACFIGTNDKFISLDQINHHSGTAAIVNATSSRNIQTIPMKSLSAVLEVYPKFQNSKLLKIDTDGFDFSIIKESLETIASLLPVLYFECDVTFQENAHINAVETLETLCKLGYERFIVYDNFGNYLISLSKLDNEKFIDLVAYLVSNRKISGTPAVYYFDICAFSVNDIDLFETIRQSEIFSVQTSH